MQSSSDRHGFGMTDGTKPPKFRKSAAPVCPSPRPGDSFHALPGAPVPGVHPVVCIPVPFRADPSPRIQSRKEQAT
jgi:hypothetical protein